MITLMIMKRNSLKKGKKAMLNNLWDGDKEQLGENDKRKTDKCLQTFDEKSNIFTNVQMCSMTGSCTLKTPAFRLTELDFSGATQEGASYIFDTCWKFKL